jgi:hypothetical protein
MSAINHPNKCVHAANVALFGMATMTIGTHNIKAADSMNGESVQRFAACDAA